MRGSMTMIGNRLNVAVDVWIEVLSALTLIDAAGDHVKQMWNDARRDEQLSFGIVIDAPRVTESMGDHLEHVFSRVIAPDTTVDLDAVLRQKFLREWIVAVIEASLSNWLSHLR